MGIAVLLAGCAAESSNRAAIYDPIEPVNRFTHSANVALDTVVLRPVAATYDFAAPTTVKFVVTNAVDNLKLPVVFVNSLLQGEVTQAGETLARFVVNTVFGAGGALDPATEMGLERYKTDFGLTLASYGVDEGPYVELPLLGPSTVRDAVGTGADLAFSLGTYLGSDVSLPIMGATAVETRDRNKALINDVLYDSPDSYITSRSLYLQNRRRAANSGETDIEALPDIFDEPTQ